LGDSRLGGGAVAVAAMSVSFRFEDNDRGYKERVRSADSNGGVEVEKRRKWRRIIREGQRRLWKCGEGK